MKNHTRDSGIANPLPITGFGSHNPSPLEGEGGTVCKRSAQYGAGVRSKKSAAFTSIGFTLAELLIALAILGVIATFTIPKILDSGSGGKKNAIAKEAAAMMSEAFQKHKLSNSITTGTSVADLTPYINYVRQVTTGAISAEGTASVCFPGVSECLELHNGSIMFYIPTTDVFSSTATTQGILFSIATEGTGQPASDGVSFVMFINGRIKTRQDCQAPERYGLVACTATADPAWFSWSN